jgi:hypothetical protein
MILHFDFTPIYLITSVYILIRISFVTILIKIRQKRHFGDFLEELDFFYRIVSMPQLVYTTTIITQRQLGQWGLAPVVNHLLSSLSLSLTYTHTLSLSLLLTLSLSHSLILSLSLTHSFSLTLSHSLTHTQSLSLSYSLTHSHASLFSSWSSSKMKKKRIVRHGR